MFSLSPFKNMTHIHQSADNHRLLHISPFVRLSKCFRMSCSRTRGNTTLMSAFRYICMYGFFWTATRCLPGCEAVFCSQRHFNALKQVAAVILENSPVYMWITNCAYKSNVRQSAPLQIRLCSVRLSPAGQRGGCERFIVCCSTGKKSAGLDMTDEFKLITGASL